VDRKLTTKEAEDLFRRLTEESEAKKDTKIDIPSSRFEKWNERIDDRIEDPDLTLRDFAEIADLDPKDQPMESGRILPEGLEELIEKLREASEDDQTEVPEGISSFLSRDQIISNAQKIRELLMALRRKTMWKEIFPLRQRYIPGTDAD